MDWTAALLTESPDPAHGIKASFQARFVLASLLYRNRESFDGNLSDIAEKIGLKESFFRRGVEELIQLAWLDVDLKIQDGLGRPVRRYKISARAQGSVGKVVSLASWQVPAAEALLFPRGKQVVEHYLPLRADIVLAVLILSANQSGFVCDLSQSAIADRSGVAVSGLNRYCKQLVEMSKLFQFPGGAGRKINGVGWLVTSVYQINFLMLIPTLPKNSLKYHNIVNDNIISGFPLNRGLLSTWPSIISNSIPQDKESDLFLKNTHNFLVRAIPSDLNNNLIARLLSATSYLISSKKFRAELISIIGSNREEDELQHRKAMMKAGKFQFSNAVEADMMNEIIKNKAIGVQFRLNVENHSYKELIGNYRKASDQGEVHDPLMLISLRLCILALRLAVYFYEIDRVVCNDVNDIQDFLYSIVWLPKQNGLFYSLIDLK